jgi:hypothetical protein
VKSIEKSPPDANPVWLAIPKIALTDSAVSVAKASRRIERLLVSWSLVESKREPRAQTVSDSPRGEGKNRTEGLHAI